MTYARDGAERHLAVLPPVEVARLAATLAPNLAPDIPVTRAGVRLHGIPGLDAFLGVKGPVGRLAASALGEGCRPVRAILFDKTSDTNWGLGWHQDRTIAVAARVEVPGYGPWSVKDGLTHVAPPADLLAGMVTLRVHLDPVDADNAPLLVAPGSHRLGRVAVADIADAVRRHGQAACLAEAGDVWLYATLVLHASDAAARPRRRRVLQVDYAVGELPGGLRWLGV
ncbi:phytanoyl-CoA dioxygenase family protein [Nitrospirillum sp. BR 11164]|uniref:phytanoyl-CoA dioxygenase family protein n=1 Tax=Nitrospirillum sp. BR 11164 TaxID=3104324 RepID=UPI002AFE5B5D|nr:phytanoyl-CoA dioxygenase family protein [Nitrospirillum sp. BR 11164]MEA1649608.1 phytanoyl-CoA dioxygenase family protein [Nitrospirillum sp. BR 11164]